MTHSGRTSAQLAFAEKAVKLLKVMWLVRSVFPVYTSLNSLIGKDRASLLAPALLTFLRHTVSQRVAYAMGDLHSYFPPAAGSPTASFEELEAYVALKYTPLATSVKPLGDHSFSHPFMPAAGPPSATPRSWQPFP